jgi:N-acetylglucosamine kinase-like BadF-type ATPase
MLDAAVQAVLAKAGLRATDLDFAYFGLPAYGEDSSLTGLLDQLPARCLPVGSYRCGNDAVCGWAGSLACSDGISVVAGTGSICYGERAGVSARCGGWGELFSDEGSAYWIATRGLNLYSRMSDGRAEPGPLHGLMRQHLGIADDLDLCAHVYRNLGADRARIAQLSRLVHAAALAGDGQAIAIFAAAADELAGMVAATRMRLAFGAGEAVPVSYSGGVFDHAGPMLHEQFAVALKNYAQEYIMQAPIHSPVIGAALYAARQRHGGLSAAALERLRQQGSALPAAPAP